MRRVELGGGAAVQLDEALDAFARLGRHLRRLGGGGEAEDEVELAPPLCGRPGSHARARPGAARPAGATARARRLRRPADRRAAASRRARRAPRRASGTRPPESRRLLPARCGVGPTRRAGGRRTLWAQRSDSGARHSQRIRGERLSGAPPSRGYAVVCGRDRLGHCPACRRAARRLAAVRGRALGVGRAAGARVRGQGGRLQRPRLRASCRRWSWSIARAGSRRT